MKKVQLVILALFLILPSAAFADQFYLGGGIVGLDAGEPDYEPDGLLVTVGYEASEKWRISFTNGKFKNENGKNDTQINTSIIGLESYYFTEINSGVLLIGAFGPGYFMAELENGSSESGTAFGLLASGTLRVYLGKDMFVDAAYHYRNASVEMKDSTLNGGYNGLVFDFGFRF